MLIVSNVYKNFLNSRDDSTADNTKYFLIKFETILLIREQVFLLLYIKLSPSIAK